MRPSGRATVAALAVCAAIVLATIGRVDCKFAFEESRALSLGSASQAQLSNAASRGANNVLEDRPRLARATVALSAAERAARNLRRLTRSAVETSVESNDNNNNNNNNNGKNGNSARDEPNAGQDAQQPALELSAFEAAKRGLFRHPPLVSAILTGAYSIVFVIGIVGNSLVVAIVCKSPRMRTVTNIFIANLAAADILVILFCLPATLVGNLFIPYVLGQSVCKTVSYLQGVAVSASINTMVTVTMDRFLAICFPLDWHMSRATARKFIACIWLFSATISLPWALFFTLVPYPLDKSTVLQVCAEDWPSEQMGNLYFICANLILLYLFPAFLITFCYLGIWWRLKRRDIPGERAKGLKIELIMQKSKLKVVKMMMVVVVIFLISWLPLYIIAARMKLANERKPWEESLIEKVMPLAQWLGASNSCINPILYTFFNRKYKRGYIDLLKGLICCRPTEVPSAMSASVVLGQANKQSLTGAHNSRSHANGLLSSAANDLNITAASQQPQIALALTNGGPSHKASQSGCSSRITYGARKGRTLSIASDDLKDFAQSKQQAADKSTRQHLSKAKLDDITAKPQADDWRVSRSKSEDCGKKECAHELEALRRQQRTNSSATNESRLQNQTIEFQSTSLYSTCPTPRLAPTQSFNAGHLESATAPTNNLKTIDRKTVIELSFAQNGERASPEPCDDQPNQAIHSSHRNRANTIATSRHRCTCGRRLGEIRQIDGDGAAMAECELKQREHRHHDDQRESSHLTNHHHHNHHHHHHHTRRNSRHHQHHSHHQDSGNSQGQDHRHHHHHVRHNRHQQTRLSLQACPAVQTSSASFVSTLGHSHDLERPAGGLALVNWEPLEGELQQHTATAVGPADGASFSGSGTGTATPAWCSTVQADA